MLTLRIGNSNIADQQFQLFVNHFDMSATELANQFVEINGTHTAYACAGDGPPLLLLHGAEGSRRSFVAITGLLAPHFTVISYDQRDCGETTNPAAASDLAALADDAAALLQLLGHSKAVVFGTSFGGRVAQAIALRHPGCIDRLILASTWPINQALQDVNAEVVQATRRLREKLPESAEQLARYFFPARFLDANPQFKRHFASAPVRSERSERRAATISDVPALDPAHIGAPTLVVAGEQDVLVPPHASLQLALAIEGADTRVLEGIGHIGHVQRPDLVAAYIQSFGAKR